MKLPVMIYECDGCGACCRLSIIEAGPLDALREPRIAEHGALLDDHGKIPIEDAAFLLNSKKDGGCVFLREDNRCEIHATRPACCVNFQAGSKKRQDMRKASGLPRLPGRVVADPTPLDRIHVVARDGGGDDA